MKPIEELDPVVRARFLRIMENAPDGPTLWDCGTCRGGKGFVTRVRNDGVMFGPLCSACPAGQRLIEGRKLARTKKLAARQERQKRQQQREDEFGYLDKPEQDDIPF